MIKQKLYNEFPEEINLLSEIMKYLRRTELETKKLNEYLRKLKNFDNTQFFKRYGRKIVDLKVDIMRILYEKKKINNYYPKEYRDNSINSNRNSIGGNRSNYSHGGPTLAPVPKSDFH
jgi:hypothetical protein